MRTLSPISRLDARAGYGAVFIRLSAGAHLIHGTQDNVRDYARMLEFRDFLAGHGFPLPLLGAHVSVYAQLVCGVLFLLGALTRPAAAVMIFNFLVALAMVHVGDPYPAVFPALFMLASACFLLLDGAGRLSVDHLLATRERGDVLSPVAAASRLAGRRG